MTEKELQVREKQEFKAGAEGTRNVPVYLPPVDIYESQDAIVILADMPGVAPEGVDVDLRDNQLTLTGKVLLEERKERMLLHEYGVGDFYRQFTLSSRIDQGKIEASMKDGVLVLTLPKAEVAKPKKITVKTS
ncbi:MAG TPA: heat-shock protein Hsp20 [Syntrophobacteraceae bacterium]|nr:heat-shock protein Hsp20 [Syntrophobacteraceae bacterium]